MHFVEQLESAKQRNDARAVGQLEALVDELTRMKLAFQADLTELGEKGQNSSSKLCLQDFTPHSQRACAAS